MPQTQPTGRDRRRKGLVPRVARATWPARRAFDAWLGGMPCSAIGHSWEEIPPSLRSARSRGAGRMEFQCRRCHAHAGFSN